MKTTVVIPNFNGIDYLKNCIQSLEEEKDHKFAVCVVDNGSKDGSVLWLQTYHPEIKLIALKENTGFCHAVNLGIKNSDTEYILLLNNDTVVLQGFIKALEQSIEESKDIFSVSAKMIDMNGKILLDGAGDLYCALGWAFARGKGKNAAAIYNEKEEIFSSCGGAAIYRKKILDEIGYFDENHFAYLEDCDIGYRARIYGYRNYYEPKARVYHAGSAVSGSRHNEFKVRLSAKNSIYLIYKNMPFFQILINLPFLIPGFCIKYFFFLKKGLGKAYLEGIRMGFSLCKKQEGRKHKVKFSFSHLPAYCKIQGMLWMNTWKRFTA